MYDCDEDGYIGRAELLYLVESMYRAMGDVTDFAPDQETPEARVDYLFERMDSDNDGRLSWQEFESGIKMEEEILDALNLYNGFV